MVEGNTNTVHHLQTLIKLQHCMMLKYQILNYATSICVSYIDETRTNPVDDTQYIPIHLPRTSVRGY